MQLDDLGVLVLGVAQRDAIDHGWRGGDEVEIVFAGQPLLDDFQMQEAQEPAAKAEAERGGAFHLVGEAGVVEPQLADALAQLLELGGVDREQPAEHHRLDFLVARQRLGRAALDRGDGVADAGLLDLLDLRGDEADLAGAQFGQLDTLGGEGADAVDEMLRAALHEAHVEALFEHPVDDAHEDDHAEIGVVP